MIDDVTTLTNTAVSFKVGKKEVSFSVWHNLPEESPLNLNNAINSWVYRTKDYTALSLCKYIRKKKTGYLIMTSYEFTKFQAQVKKNRGLKLEEDE